ncbi:MAG: hypothetical protein AAF456_09830, partial [Planctomycetota bacterium]
MNAGAPGFAITEVNREDASRQITIRLDEEEWVEFQLAPNSTTLRLLTNAEIDGNIQPVETQSDPRAGFRYSIEYELLDNSRNIVSSSEYHFRSRLRQLIDADTGEVINPLVFGSTGHVATQTRTMQLPTMTHEGTGTILRVRINSTDPELTGVVARVISRVERANYDNPSTWHRVGNYNKVRISKFCVYNHSLLTLSERTNLLRWQWVESATAGVYDSSFMYFIGDMDDQEAGLGTLPAGMYMEPGWHATIPVPEATGRMRIEFFRIDSSRVGAAVISARWQGSEIEDREERLHTIENSETPLEMDVKGGIVELTPSEPIVVTAFFKPAEGESTISAISDGDEFEITPETHYLRSYLIDTRPVTFDISHVSDQATPFRLSIRRAFGEIFLTEESEHSLQGRIPGDEVFGALRWEFLDSSGQVVSSAVEEFETTASFYDRLWKADRSYMVTDAAPAHFNIPPAVSAIRFYSDDGPLLISGSVRPQELPSTTCVPEDYLAFEKSGSTNRRWFKLKPRLNRELIAENRSFVLRTREHLPEVDPELLAGNFEWIRFEPAGDWIGNQLFVPVEAEPELHVRAADAMYYSIQSDFDYPFEIKSTALTSGRAKIVFESPGSPGPIRVFCNDEVVFDEDMLSTRGVIEFDTSHLTGRLRVECEAEVRLLLGGCYVGDVPCFIKRKAVRVNDDGLEFVFEKTTADEELVTL